MLSPLPLTSCTSEIESWSSEGGSAERGGAGPSAKGLQRLLTHLSRRTYWLRGRCVGQAMVLDVGWCAVGSERRVSGSSNRARRGRSRSAAQAVSLDVAHAMPTASPSRLSRVRVAGAAARTIAQRVSAFAAAWVRPKRRRKRTQARPASTGAGWPRRVDALALTLGVRDCRGCAGSVERTLTHSGPSSDGSE